jgi:hypothetical protein
MEKQRGDLSLLDHDIARQLLQSRIPARVAYLALDGTPRLVPMLFHWTGKEIVLTCWPDDPKVAAMRQRPTVALSIDTADPPFRVLQLRGTASVTVVDGQPPEMVAAFVRYMGPEAGQAMLDQSQQLSPQTVRIAVAPHWVDVLDFETRLPGPLLRRLSQTPA